MSRLISTRGDTAKCWRNAARLQDQAGDTDAARQSRKVAVQISSTNAWIREHGPRK